LSLKKKWSLFLAYQTQVMRTFVLNQIPIQEINVTYTGFFSNRNICSVKINCTLHDFPSSCNVLDLPLSIKLKNRQSEPKENSFTAVAITEMNSLDVWSINENGILTHENDGSE